MPASPSTSTAPPPAAPTGPPCPPSAAAGSSPSGPRWRPKARPPVARDPAGSRILAGRGCTRPPGATAVGAREVLVAYNVDLADADLELARRIATAVRERDGGLPAVRAMGVDLAGRGLAQVSMNLLDYRVTPPAVAFAAVAALAELAGARVAASEIVGLVPAAALAGTDPADLRLRDFTPDLLLEKRLARALDTHAEVT
jgi:glutamate formiminotransferase